MAGMAERLVSTILFRYLREPAYTMGIGALRSLVSTHSFACRMSCFSATFFDLNRALDLITTLLKMRSWVNSIWAIAFHARVPPSGVGVVRIRWFR